MLISTEASYEIVHEMKAILGCDVNIMDETGTIIASTDPSRVGHRHPGACTLLERGLESLTVETDNPVTGERRGINLPIQVQGITMGVVGLTGAPEKVAVYGRMIQRMTEIMVRDSLQQEQAATLERARQCFVEAWLFDEKADATELSFRGKMLGIDTRAPWAVALLSASDANTMEQDLQSAQYLNRIKPYLHRDIFCLCAVLDQQMLLLLQSSDTDRIRDKVEEIRRELSYIFRAPVYGGISGSGHRGPGIRCRYHEAKSALRTAQNAREGLVSYKESSLAFLADSISPEIRKDLAELVFSDCPPEEQAEMRQLIMLFYRSQGNVQKIADQLHVHKNTIHYRLQKIKKLTGYSLHVPEDAMLLYLVASLPAKDQMKK